MQKLNELVINDSATKVVRAGFGNMVIPLSFVALVLLNQLLLDLNVSIYFRSIVTLFVLVFFVKLYLSNISKISIDEHSLNFTTPLDVKSIRKNEIKSIKIYPIRVNRTVVLFVWNSNKMLPTIYSFVTVNSFTSCVEWLKKVSDESTQAPQQV